MTCWKISSSKVQFKCHLLHWSSCYVCLSQILSSCTTQVYILCLRPFTGCREIHSIYMSDSTEVFGNWHPWAEPSNTDAHDLVKKYFIFLPPQVERHWDVFFTLVLRPQWDWVQLPITVIGLAPCLASSDPLPNKSCPQILLSASREIKAKIYWKYFFSDPIENNSSFWSPLTFCYTRSRVIQDVKKKPTVNYRYTCPSP